MDRAFKCDCRLWARCWVLIVSTLLTLLNIPVSPPVFAAETTKTPPAGATIHADIVALDQLIVYNRFGSFDPYGMVFALQRDVTAAQDGVLEEAATARECANQTGAESGSGVLAAGQVRLRDCKRPRPLVLRANVGDVLQVNVKNLLRPQENVPGVSETFCKIRGEKRIDVSHKALRGNVTNFDTDPTYLGKQMCKEGGDGKPEAVSEGVSADWPFTRGLSFAIPGVEVVYESVPGVCRGMTSISPDQEAICQFKLNAEGTHLFQSMAAATGGEGDGGSLTHGLFGALIVEKNGTYYRSQVSRGGFKAAWPEANNKAPHVRQGTINFDHKIKDTEVTERMSAHNPCRPFAETSLEMPVLEMVRACNGMREIVHGDLNAVVVPVETHSKSYPKSHQSEGPFREFVVIFHDELKTYYTKEFEDLAKFEQFSGIRDGFAINYGASGAGSLVLANRKKIGPARHCPECLYEEFFLESWANGDPALLESFPDDPSNVHHSYLNDRIVFRNFHAGPKETHVFHLHAHQWFAGNDENRGAYLDSNTIGPQQGISYNINQGGMSLYRPKGTGYPDKGGFWETLGSGNRNRTPGDSIFHCHLYPHFAQGMWELWRTHDVLEDGSRTLPDGQLEEGLSLTSPLSAAEWADENKRLADQLKMRKGTSTASGPLGWADEASFNPAAEGTPIPGLIPMPRQAAPLLPTYTAKGFPGYPYYIAGEVGHRTPQAPLDIAVDRTATGERELRDGGLGRHVVVDGTRTRGPHTGSFPVAETVAQKLAVGDMTEEFEKLKIKLLPHSGTALEKRAMAFHHDGRFDQTSNKISLDLIDYMGTRVAAPGAIAQTANNLVDRVAYKSLPVEITSGSATTPLLTHFPVNGAPAKPGAPFADPCGAPDALGGTAMSDPFDGKNWINDQAKYPTRRPLPYRETVAAGADRLMENGLGPETPKSMTYDPALTGFRRFRASAVQLDMVVNKAGWHDPQARINVPTEDSDLYKNKIGSKVGGTEPYYFRAYSGECIEFRHTNELPKDLALDDFQMKVPTDTIGQHIHLVKFDVTSADGSGNGFNYEDGTFAADELAARIKHSNWLSDLDNSALLDETADDKALRDKSFAAWQKQCKPIVDEGHELWKESKSNNPACFQTTVQRWFADPILSSTGENPTQDDDEAVAPRSDRTLRTVFTHDHFGPSNIQQHGFYAALLIEPQTMKAKVYDDSRTTSLTQAEADPKLCLRSVGNVSGRCETYAPKWTAIRRSSYTPPSPDHEVSTAQCAKAVLKARGFPTSVSSSQPVTPPVAFDTACEYQAPLVASMGDNTATATTSKSDVSADSQIGIAQYSEYGVGARATVVTDREFGNRALGEDPMHPNYREFALAIADFALLYDGQKLSSEEIAKDREKGIDQLIIEAKHAKSFGPNPKTCGAAFENRHDPVVPADAVKCQTPAAADTWLQAAATALTNARNQLRAHGKPISPPERPEAISQTHHDPYLVNYRNDPIPLRIGETSAGKSANDGGTCPDNFNVTERTVEGSVIRQKGDDKPGGDMANVFRSAEHGDPCTPILENYAGERVMVRLIQGAQEVQHVFTLEGRTFRRNVDQNFEYGAWITPAPNVAGAPTRWLQCMKAGMVDRPLQHAKWFGKTKDLKHKKNADWLKRYRALVANCDNLRGEVSAQEIGISEHFEFAGNFSSDSGAVAEAARVTDQTRVSPALGIRDSLYHFGSVDAQWNGAWGVIRTYADGRSPDITKCLKSSASDPAQAAASCGISTRVSESEVTKTSISARLAFDAQLAGPVAETAATSDTPVLPSLDVPENARVNASLGYPGLACPFLPEQADGKDKGAYYQSTHVISGVAAISARDLGNDQGLKGIRYDRWHGLYDPNGLLLVPLTQAQLQRAGISRAAIYSAERRSPNLDGSYDLGIDSKLLLEEIIKSAKAPDFVPYVARINAGDCLHLVVINMLRNHGSDETPKQIGSTRSGLTDWPGDAILPNITSLNVDQYVVGEDHREVFKGDLNESAATGKKCGVMESDGAICEVTPSASLALSIPASVMSNVNDLPDPVGVNPVAALAPWDRDANAIPKASVMTIFGGKIGFNASGLNKALYNAQTTYKPNTTCPGGVTAIDVSERCVSPSTKAENGATGTTALSSLHCPFNRDGVDYHYVIWPVNRRSCSDVAGDETEISMNVLGRKYCARTELTTTAGVNPKPDYAELQSCIIKGVTMAVELRDDNLPLDLRVIPQAAGALPVKSISDVISHGPHGLAGSLIVEAENAIYPGREKPMPGDTKIETTGNSAYPSFEWKSTELGSATAQPATTLTLKEVELHRIGGFDDYYDETIPEVTAMDEQSLLWQDGLNLWDAYRRPVGEHEGGTCFLASDPMKCVFDNFIGGPLPDCIACDDSYDRGERGASYAAPALFARVRGTGNIPFDIGPDQLTGIYNEHSDLAHYQLPQNIFNPAWSPTPAQLIVQLHEDREAMIRIVAAQGRARQRAFVPLGTSYADLFPGFGAGHTSLLAPGKAVNAAIRAPVHPQGQESETHVDYLWFDGPRQMLSNGAWGVLRVNKKK